MNIPSQSTLTGINILAVIAMLSLAIVAKYVVECSRRQLSAVGPGSYIYTAKSVFGWKHAIAYRIFRYSFHARPILAILLPVVPGIAGLMLALSIITEMYVLFKYHLMLVAGLCLLVASMSMKSWSALNPLSTVYAAPFAPFVQALIIAMYGLSAVRKWRNGFANGNVLKFGIAISLSERSFNDHVWLSGSFLEFIGRHMPFPLAAKVVIGWEMLAACLLALPYPLWNLSGVVMALLAQLSFTVLFPRTLLPFTLAVISGLCLWL